MEFIVNADDLGISPGINKAISDLIAIKALTHASWLVNTIYFNEVYNVIIKNNLNFNFGLHFNLTYSDSICVYEKIPLLVDETHRFKNNFFDLLILNHFRKNEFYKQVKLELGAQLQKALDCTKKLSHIDGHWHIQMIPAIYEAIKELAEKYKIKRIRIINENIRLTSQIIGRNLLFKSKILNKYLIMKYFQKLNRINDHYYLFSYLLSSELKPDYFKNIDAFKNFEIVEIMVHPGNTAIDKEIDLKNYIVNKYIKSEFRDLEFEFCKHLKSVLWQ